MPSWFRHALAWLAGLAALLVLFQWEAMHELDARLASRLMSREVAFDGSIVLVDVPKGRGIPDFRLRLGAMLEDLAAQPAQLPRVVGLDMWFESDTAGFEPVVAGVAALRVRQVPVVAAVNVRKPNSDEFDPDYAKRHSMTLYSTFDAVAHNAFNMPTGSAAWAFYVPCPGGRWPEAMAVSLASLGTATALRSGATPAGPCGRIAGAERRVALGPLLSASRPEQILGFDASCEQRWRHYGGGCLAHRPEFRNRIVIVGRLADDPSPYAGRSGPEVVGWAVTDLVQAGRMAGSRQLLSNDWLHLGLVLLTSAIGLLAFGGLLRFLREWRLRPLRIAAVAGAVGVLIPAGMIGLARLLGHDFGQVLLPMSALAMSLALATHHRLVALRAQAEARSELPEPDFAAYDVFVSYRHSQQDWVTSALVPLLAQLRHIDNRPVSYFLDAEGIHAGQHWTTRLGQVIAESTVFLTVLSPDYFQPNAQGHKVCEWELGQALLRQAEDTMTIVPIFHAGYEPDRDTPHALPHLRPIQGVRSTDPDMAAKVREAIVGALSRSRPPA
jgi:hypothetical protein